MKSLERWLEQSCDASVNADSKSAINSFRVLMDKKKVFLWGSGSVVRLYIDLFKKIGLSITGIIDKQNHGDVVEGFRVVPPDTLYHVDDPANTVVVTSVGSTLVASYIAADFESMQLSIPPIVFGYRLFYALQSLVCRQRIQNGDSPELGLCPMCKTFGSPCTLLLEQVNEKHGGDLVLSLLAYGLGTICTLKCEYCVEGMPYIPHEKRAYVSVDTVLKDIRRIAEACDYIVRLDFCGGEPFLHPQLDEILSFALTVDNIGSFYVITNGTVVPNDPLCLILKNPRIKVVVSDYSGQLSSQQEANIIKTVQKLNSSGISMEQRKQLVWSDMSSFEPRMLSDEQMETAYKSCLFVNSRRLHEGVLYPCLHYFAGVQTRELICDPKECLHIHDIKDNELADAVKAYLQKPFVSACDRCMAPFDAPEVPAAKQLGHQNAMQPWRCT